MERLLFAFRRELEINESLNGVVKSVDGEEGNTVELV